VNPISFLCVATLSFSVAAQNTTDGKLIFQNINIAVASGATTGGSNNNGTYNVPIYTSASSTKGFGLVPGGAMAGLFLTGQTTPLATSILGTAAGSAPFFATPFTQIVTIPGAPAGSTPSLTIKVWQNTNFTYEQAAAFSFYGHGSLTFNAPPLGGIPPGGGAEIPIPTLTGWGNINGSGFRIDEVPEPSTIGVGALGLGIMLIRRCKS
jgi:hypothetical protein